MRLKKIKIAGFKSFAQTTEIHLPGQLIGIVGPNGCGKSNVMDAIKWVLGESRAGALRGDSMQDVLFNGSANKPPAGRAFVELLFENKGTHNLGAFGKYAEIAISRVLVRGGTSDYFINQIKVRRRDITELFSGTGLSANAYAIISQGTISNLIEAKPEELCSAIEEVAGIARYKDRKRETQNRLNDTQNHLLRLNDLLHTLSKQILHLKQQAQTAEIFQNKNNEKKETQNLLWRLRFHKAKNEAENFKIEKLKAENAFEENQIHLNSLMKEIENLMQENEKINQILQEAQHYFYAENSKWLAMTQEKNIWEKEKNHCLNQLKQLNFNQENLNKEKQELNNSFFNLENQQKESLEIIKNIQKEKEILNKKISDFENSLKKIENDYLIAQKNMQTERQNVFLWTQKNTHCLENLKKIQERKERFLNQTMEHFDENLLNDSLQYFSQKKAEKEILNQHIFEKKNALTVEKENLLGLKKQMHDDEKQKAENLSAQKVLKNFLPQQDSLFLKELKIKNGFEKAVEVILKEKLFAQKIENLNNFIENKKHFCFFEIPEENKINKIKENALIHFIDAPKDLHLILSIWLQDVLLSENLEWALNNRTILSENEVFVTPKGEIVSQYDLLLPNNQKSDLANQQKLNVLEEEENYINLKIEKNKNEILLLEKSVFEKENNIKEEMKIFNLLESEMRSLEIKIEKLKTEKKQKEQFFENLEKEKKLLLEEEKELLNQKEEIQNNLILFEKNKTETENIFTQQKTCFDIAQQNLKAQKEMLQQYLQKEKEESFKIKTRENQLNDFQNRLNKTKHILENNQKEIENQQNKLNEFNQKEWDEDMRLSLENKLKAENQLKENKEQAKNIYEKIQHLEEKRLLLTQQGIPLQQSIADFNLKETRALDTMENVKTQFLECNENEKNLWLTVENPKNYSIQHLQNKIQNLNHEIQLLGAVNLRALEELNVQIEKETYLNQQLKDLNEAVESLNNAILKIDDESKMRFNETLNAVNLHFGEMFKAVFGAGFAVLENVENGLCVLAKPPGKKNARLSMLSGGEKALTAIALVFALFLLQPAPFCLLDEVDAPLDDSNTERFCQLVKKMSDKTQFLFVSHNKIAMAMAEQLIGVTMREQGASRVVDVDIKEAILSLGDENL